MSPSDAAIARVRTARVALEVLDGELANELGAGYPRTQRYRELVEGTGPAASETERPLMARLSALMTEGRVALAAASGAS